MTDGHSTPTVRARWIVTVFAVAMAVTAVWSWRIVSNVCADARLADEQLRTVAWAVLLHADRAAGFPRSEAELLAVPFATSVAGDPQERWPATDVAAGIEPGCAGDAFVGCLRTVLDRLAIQFSSDLRQPPNLTSGGRATGVGTLATVNGWMRGRADAMVEGGG